MARVAGARRCRRGLDALSKAVDGWRADAALDGEARSRSASAGSDDVLRLTGVRDVALPYDGEVIGAVQRIGADSPRDDIVVCAAGTLPGELHKLWRTSAPGGYHVEYGYSCMGYEIAGGLGVKMARPDREVVVMVGDGSYLMLNAEIATSVMLGHKLVVVVLDNRGYGCINRLQQAVGGAPFNNLLDDCVQGADGAPRIDFAATCALARCAGRARDVDRRARSGAAARARRRRAPTSSHRHRPGAHHRGGRLVVGRRGARGFASAAKSQRARASATSSERQAQRAMSATSQRRGPREFDVRIGINPISWSNDDLPSLGGEIPLETALAEGKAIGYEGFELGNKFPRESAGAARGARAHGLSLVSGWYSGRLARRSVDEEIAAVGAASASCSPTTARR